jgi:hypothetical protein
MNFFYILFLQLQKKEKQYRENIFTVENASHFLKILYKATIYPTMRCTTSTVSSSTKTMAPMLGSLTGSMEQTICGGHGESILDIESSGEQNPRENCTHVKRKKTNSTHTVLVHFISRS